MLLIVPYKSSLRLGRIPYVTYIIMFLCLVIYYFQSDNNTKIIENIEKYCVQINDVDSLDHLKNDAATCVYEIKLLHSLPDKKMLPVIFVKANEEYEGEYKESPAELNQRFDSIQYHYQKIEPDLPFSLDSLLMFDPSFFNPVRTITSALSHGSWWHLIGNLIFFLAFSSALELLTGSRFKYIGIMFLIGMSYTFMFSLSALFGALPLPALGLSGVVAGLIGYSAFMMPWVRIKTLVWIFVYIRIFYVPAWMLAVWFIGWDTYTLFTASDYGGISFMGHVVGGFSGYFIGYYFFQERRKEINYELNDEVEYMRAERDDKSSYMSSYKGDARRINSEYKAHQENVEYGRYVSQIFKLANSGNHSEAILLVLTNYELHVPSVEVYESLFFEMCDWKKGRTFLCLGRLVIHLLLENKLYARAVKVAEECFGVDEGFVFGSPADEAVLTKKAREQGELRLLELLNK